MIRFTFKKAFFDIWDNMVKVMLMNLPYAAVVILFYICIGMLQGNPVLSFAGLVLDVLLFSFYSLFVNVMTYRFTKYEKREVPVWTDMRQHLPHVFMHALVYALILFMGFYGIPAYLSMNTVLSSAIGMLVVWLCLIALLSMQYYYPLCMYAPDDGPVATFKRCLSFVMNNIGWSFVLALKNLVALAVSIVTGLVIPGPVGISVSRMTMTRCIIIVYEYLRDNPDSDRRSLVYEEVFFNENELIGDRDFVSMVFPRRK